MRTTFLLFISILDFIVYSSSNINDDISVRHAHFRNKNNHELTSEGVEFTMNQTSAVVIMGEHFQTEIKKEIVQMVYLEL